MLLLPKGVVTVIRDKRYQVVTATTAHYRMLDDLCAGQDKAYYEELLQELQEDFGFNADAEELFPRHLLSGTQPILLQIRSIQQSR